MSAFKLFLMLFCFSLSIQTYAAKEKEEIPKEDKWGKKNERDATTSPLLYQDDSSVYVYSEKQLDNLTIGITDMMGNVVYEETTTIPAGMYYAVSIDSLPAGTYYFSIIQGSKYVIGMFIKE